MLKSSLVFLAVMFLTVPMVQGADKGQVDLDKATDLQLKAETLAELKEVADLCESAIKKGLDKDNVKFAKRLITSSLYQRADRYVKRIERIFNQRRRINREQLKDLRGAALKDLNRLIKHNAEYGNAWLAIGRLQAIQGGDRKKAVEAANRAVKIYKDNKNKRVEALLLRSQVVKDDKKKLADLSEAIKLAPNNQRIWQARFQHYIAKGQLDNAIGDLKNRIKANPKNDRLKLMLAELYGTSKKYDDAFKLIDAIIKKKPQLFLAYQTRARINISKGDFKAGIKDLTEGLKVKPNDIGTILLRGELNLRAKLLKAAREDATEALKLSRGIPQAIRQATLLRIRVSAEEKKFPEAIRDTITLISREPAGSGFANQLQLQLAFYYVADKRPRRAIKVYDLLLKTNEANFLARQARADTALSIGAHKKAIGDYELLLKQRPKSDNILNNLAWTLATSPDKEVRNGKRAIQLSVRACEATKYQKPHILSTLAASYAEVGDFKNAIKWSTKAVEMEKKLKIKNISAQLQKELDSYRKKKPWRERQNIKENPAPLGKNLIEA